MRNIKLFYNHVTECDLCWIENAAGSKSKYGPRNAKTSSGICGQRRPRSACASAQSDQGLRCPQTESLNTIECFNGEQMPGRDFAHVKDIVNLHILRML